MATAKKLPSGSWRCQVFDRTEEVAQPDGSVKKKRIYRSFTCTDPTKKGKRTCEQMAADWAVQKETGAGRKADLSFGEGLEKYISMKKSVLSPSTVCGYESISRKLSKEFPDFCRKQISRVTEADIQGVINRVSEENSPKTVRNVSALIAPVMAQFRPEFRFQVSLPQKARPDLYIPTDEDIRYLTELVAGTDLELPVLLAAFGPMRRGEICALESQDIAEDTVHVCRNMVRQADGEWIVKVPKSYAGDRFIVYPDFVEKKWEGKEGRLVELTPNEISDQFRNCIRKSGLPHFRFHDLRHYSASVQHALGVPDSYIMARGGWGSDGTLKSVYRHAMSDRAEQMNGITNSHFEELCNTKCNTEK